MKTLKKYFYILTDWIDTAFLGHVSVIILVIILLTVSIRPWLGFSQSSLSYDIKVMYWVVAIFTVLILYQTSLLRSLYRITHDNSNTLLHTSYPPSHWEQLLSSRSGVIWFFGLNLRRMIFPDHTCVLEEFLNNGGVVNALVVDPDDPQIIEYGAWQDEGRKEEDKVCKWKATVENTILNCLELETKFPGHVNIRTTNYPLAFGLDAVDIDSTNGVIYVRFYPLFTGQGDKPILVLHAGQSLWFDFYKEQLKLLWGDYYSKAYTNAKDNTRDKQHDTVAHRLGK